MLLHAGRCKPTSGSERWRTRRNRDEKECGVLVCAPEASTASAGRYELIDFLHGPQLSQARTRYATKLRYKRDSGHMVEFSHGASSSRRDGTGQSEYSSEMASKKTTRVVAQAQQKIRRSGRSLRPSVTVNGSIQMPLSCTIPPRGHRMFARQIAFLFAFVACSLAFLGCSSGSSEPADAPLTAWSGSWRAIETYMRSSAFDPVAQAIHEQRPEYTAEEIKAIFAAGHDVDFTDLVVTDDSLTFTDGATVVCAGKYESDGSHAEGHDPEAAADHDHHGATFTFRLLEARGGECWAYATVAFGSEPEVASDAEGEYAHFHLQAGPPRPAPWSPGVVTPITPDRFTKTQLANASAYAQGLPPK